MTPDDVVEAMARDKATQDAYRSAASFAHQMGNAGKDAFAVAREMDRRAAALTEEIAAVRAEAVKVEGV